MILPLYVFIICAFNSKMPVNGKENPKGSSHYWHCNIKRHLYDVTFLRSIW